MSKTIRIKLIALSIVLALFVVFSVGETFAWFGNTVTVYTADGQTELAKLGMRINLLFDRLDPDKFPNGSTITFPDGTTGTFDNEAQWGTKDNPYIISMARHMLNLYVLQRNGYFEERYISQNYDENGNYIADSNIKPYFLVCDTAAAPTCVDGTRNGEPLELHPVGNDEYPFIGCVGGAQVEGTATAPNGKTSISSIISNFNVVSDVDEPDIGLFGYVGYLGDENATTSESGVEVFNGAVSGISDLLLYDVCITGPTAAPAARDDAHRWANEVAQNVQYEEDHHVGILAGHVEYAAIQNISVYYSDSSKTAINIDQSGANYHTDSGIIGFVYNLNPSVEGNSIGAASGTTIAGQVQGVGQEWGGSIDMKKIYDRLSDVYDTANSSSIQYASRETVTIHKDINGETISSEVTTDATGRRNTYYISYKDDEASYSFVKHSGGTKQYLYLYGEDTIESFNAYFETVNGNTYITDGKGNYLRYNNGLTNTTNINQASVWTLDSNRRISSNGNYLSISNNSLSTTTTQRYGTQFTVNNSAIYSGTNYLLCLDGTWTGGARAPFNKTVTTTIYKDRHAMVFSDGNGNYLHATTNSVQNTTDASNGTKWVLENGALCTQTADNETVYYLNNNNGSLSVSTTNSTTNWTVNGDVVSSGDYKLLYYNGSWTLSTSLDYYYILHGSDRFSVTINGNQCDEWFVDDSGYMFVLVNGTAYYLQNNDGALTTTNARANASQCAITTGRVTVDGLYLAYENGSWQLTPAAQVYKFYAPDNRYMALAAGDLTTVSGSTNATGWIAEAPDGSGRIYTTENNTRYYLYNNNGALAVTQTANNATNWTIGEHSLTSGDLYVSLNNNVWCVNQPGTYRVIGDGKGNYLRYTGTGFNTTNLAQASDWVFSADSGNNVTISTTVGNQTYYLRRNSANGTTLQITTANTYNTWTVDDDGKIHNGDYYLSCTNGTWSLAQSQTYYLIHSGDHYLNATASGVADETSADDATRWTFSSASTGTNITIAANVNGSTRYLSVSRSGYGYWNYTYTLTTATNYQYWRRNNATVGYLQNRAYNTTVYVHYNNNTWSADTSSMYLTFTQVTEAINSKLTLITRSYDTTVDHEVHEFDLNITHAIETVSGEVDDSAVINWKTVTTTTEGSSYQTYDTYFPLTVDEDGSTHTKNTGYIISGSSLGINGIEDYANSSGNFSEEAKGDIRVSFYAQSNISGSLTNGNLADSKIYTVNNGTKQTVSAYGVRNFAKYDKAKEEMQAVLDEDGTNVYGLHFMDAQISKNNLVTIPTALINETTYTNYEMPRDGIDFRLRTKGYINFFAGTYFTGNNSFFSLHQIIRDPNNISVITDIKEILEVYSDGNAKHPYIYRFSDGYAYSSGVSVASLPQGYSSIYQTAWIKTQSDMTNNAVYYFEVPIDAGEYALGSVPGSDGAYLMYLDIGTSAADHSSVLGTIDFVYDNLADKIVVVPDVNDTDTSLNYYVPSMSVLFSKNTDENNTVDIDRFTLNVTRTIASVNDTAATMNVTYGGDDAEHMTAIKQVNNMGDAIVLTP